jgi:multicomponent Na+:H+ antiporter subunit D
VIEHEPGSLAVPAVLTTLSLLLGLVLGLGALFRDRFPAGLRAGFKRVWVPFTRALRTVHSGHVGDSVTWLVVGVAGLGAMLTLVVR